MPSDEATAIRSTQFIDATNVYLMRLQFVDRDRVVTSIDVRQDGTL